MSDQELTALFQAVEAGDDSARTELFVALYGELHGVAERALRHVGRGTMLSATTVLHEAYLNLLGRRAGVFPDRARFLSYAASCMRRLILDYARNHRAQKRGGQFEITSLPTEVPEDAADVLELQELGAALENLAKADPRLAEVVDLKFFCGLSLAEIAALRAVSERTVQRDWDKARVFLHRSLQKSDGVLED